MIRLRKFIVPLLFILVGLLTAPWEGDQKWIWRGMILYSIPLACYLSNSFKAKEVGILVGACTLMQALASPFLLDKVTLRDYITLKPNFHKVINVKEGSVLVGNKFGNTLLDNPYSMTSMSKGKAPGQAKKITKNQLKKFNKK